MHHMRGMRGRSPLRWIAMGLMFGVFAVAAAFAVSFVAMSLWNWLLPPIFGLKTITYWQALGLLVLSWIFFGRFRGGHWHRRRHHWRHRLHERMAGMSPEEMKRFAEEMQDWHHRHPDHG